MRCLQVQGQRHHVGGVQVVMTGPELGVAEVQRGDIQPHVAMCRASPAIRSLSRTEASQRLGDEAARA